MSDDRLLDYIATGEIFCKEQFSVAEAVSEEAVINSLLAKAGKQRRPDRLYVALKLYHAGIKNKNNDSISLDEANAGLWNLVDVPVDINHGTSHKKMMSKQSLVFSGLNHDVGKIIGTSIYAEMVEANGKEPAHPLVLVGVYKDKFPKEAADMEERASRGQLKFSYEVMFKRFQCAECGQIYTGADNDICEHLTKDFHSRSTRNLLDILHTAVSRVDDPADVNADSVALGENLTIGDALGGNVMSDNDKGILLDGAALAKAILELSKEDAAKKVEETLSSVKATLLEKETAFADTLEEKDGEIQDLQKMNEKLASDLKTEQENSKNIQTRFDEFKAEIEAERSLAGRLSRLSEAGYQMPEDSEKKESALAHIKTMSDEHFDFFLSSVAKHTGEDPAGGTEEEPSGGSPSDAGNEELIAASKQAPGQKQQGAAEASSSAQDPREEKLNKAFAYIAKEMD